MEIQRCFNYQYLIINDTINQALLEMKSIVISHRNKTPRFLRNRAQNLPIILQEAKSFT